MKKFVFVFTVLAVMLAGCKNDQSSEKKTLATIPEGQVVPVAVINTDSILANYEFAVQANEDLMSKQENARLDLNQRARALQNDMATFQNKMENNAFLSRERAEAEYARLQKRQQELQELEAKMSDEFMAEQQRLTQQMHDSIDNVIADLNKEGKFRLVVTTSSLIETVLYCDPELDITVQVVDMLNERWQNGKKK
ncbi:MAG: OmpH family outer membrane protein [bacterium]|nr:OmpH family outer membrane protein [Candidatus Minthenecus merdequi]